MKEGTEVKVIANLSGHDFKIGEIVKREYVILDDELSVAFRSGTTGVWYMRPDEYEIVNDKKIVLDRLGDTIRDLQVAGFSREVWEGVMAAYDQGLEEMGDE